MKGLYKVDCWFSRAGWFGGMFVADTDEVEKLSGVSICQDDCLGKHSEISLSLGDPDFVTLVTTDQDFIAKCEEYGIASLGQGRYLMESARENYEEDSEVLDE